MQNEDTKKPSLSNSTLINLNDEYEVEIERLSYKEAKAFLLLRNQVLEECKSQATEDIAIRMLANERLFNQVEMIFSQTSTLITKKTGERVPCSFELLYDKGIIGDTSTLLFEVINLNTNPFTKTPIIV